MAVKIYRYQYGLLDVVTLQRDVGALVAISSQTPGPLIDLSLEETFKGDLDEVMALGGWAFVGEVLPAALAAALVSPEPNVVRWAGGVTAAALVPIVAYFSDSPKAGTSWSATPFGYPLPLQRQLRRMRVAVDANTLTVATTFTIHLDSVATAITVTVPAGTTGNFQETAAVVSSPNWGKIDLRADVPAGAGMLTFSACLLV